MTRLLNSRKTYFFLLFIAITLRVLFEVNNPKLTSDHSIQIEAAKNYIESGTFSHSWVQADDLSKINLSPLKMWPLGLSFAVLFFNMFTDDLIYANICFQVLASLLFISGALRLLNYFKVSLPTINLFLLLYAFNPAPFSYLGSTDLFTGSLFLWITYFSLKESESAVLNFKNITWIALLSWFCAVMRFACIPNIVIVPFFFFLAGLILRKKNYFIKAGIIMGLTTLFVLIFYKLFPIDNSRTGFIETIKSGNFYYSHLKWFDAFPVKGLFFTRPIEFHLPHKPFLILAYRITLHILSFGFLLLILLSFIPKMKLKTWLNNFKQRTDKEHLLILLFAAISAVIIGFITLQSLTTPPEANSFGPSWMPPLWTFVYTTRYFIYIIMLIIILYFIACQNAVSKRKGTSKILLLAYPLFLAWAVFYFAFINYQYYSPKGNGGGSEWKNKKNQIEAYRLINSLKSENPQMPVVHAHYKDKLVEGLITNYAKANSTDDYDLIVQNKFSNSEPLILLLTMPLTISAQEEDFLKTRSHTVMKKLDKEQIVRFNLQ